MIKRDGHILVFTLAVLGILFILTTAALNLVRYDQHFANKSYLSKQAHHIAEAGVDLAIRRLNEETNYFGEENVSIGNGTATIVVTGTGNTRRIEVSGFVPDAAEPRSKRKIIVDASLGSDSVEFFYGIQVGGGGLSMTNNSRVIGNVFSNGNIIGSNTATITGDAVVAGGLTETPTLGSDIEDADQFFATTASNRDIAQSFTATASGPLTKVSVFLGKVGNPSNNLTLRLTADNANKPATWAMTSVVISPTMVGATPSWIDVAFSSPPNLSLNTKYWLVLDYSSNSATNYWNWRKDSSDSYPNNTGKSTGDWTAWNANWSNVNGDLSFGVWIGGISTRIEGMTIGTSSSGSARANQFVNTTVRGNDCPNQHCIVDNLPSQALPIPDGLVQDWKNIAQEGGVHIGDYNLSGTSVGNIGPIRINGNLNLSNSAILNVTGTLWITGNLNLNNLSVVRLDQSYGSNSGTIVVDGTINVSNNITIEGSGTAGSYIMLLSDRNAKEQESISVNNASSAVIYYASKSRIQFSNNAQAKEATAWGINMSNQATITYDSGLSNVSFTSGPGGGWQIQAGTWREIINF